MTDEAILLLVLVKNRIELVFAAENLSEWYFEVFCYEPWLLSKKVSKLFHSQYRLKDNSIICYDYRHLQIFEQIFENISRFFQFARNMEILCPKIVTELNF
jgi:hypothetical protein